MMDGSITGFVPLSSHQVLNLFLALLLSSFGSENLQKSETEEEPNKLAEAINRFKRFGSWVKVKVIVCLKMRLKMGKTKPPPCNMPISPDLNGKEPLVDGVVGASHNVF